MHSFSPRSLEHYATLHPDLQRICDQAIKIVDFTILEGHRDAKKQEEAWLKKVSKLRWPNSRHNSLPSEAMDLVPHPLDWKETKRFYYLAGVILGCAKVLGTEIAWGGHWEKLRDLPHFELVR